MQYLSQPYAAIPKRIPDPTFLLGTVLEAVAKSAQINAAITTAFLALKDLYKDPYEDIYCSRLSDDTIVAEVFNSDTKLSTIVAYSSQNGEMQASICGEGVFKPFPTLAAQSKISFFNMVALYLPLVAHSLSDPWFQDFSECFNNSRNINYLYAICELVKAYMNDNKIKLAAFYAGNPQPLSERKLKLGTYSGGKVFCGVAHYLNANQSEEAKSVTVGRAKQEFAAYTSTLHWTKEEKLLIPSFPDDFVVPAVTLKFARLFIATQKDKRPMVQFMWRGPTSIGKSTGIECLATILHTPLLRMTCHPTMETRDFLADYVPDTSNYAPAHLPSFEDIEFNPVESYEVLTGKQDENATCQMCLEAYAKAVASHSDTPRFRFVESNYVKALTRGYICEIQEASRIRNAGTLVGLNEFDRPGSVIPLVDDTYKTRHPNAIVVISDNKGYASCRPVDPSVLRRMDIIVDSDDLKKEELFARVQYNTGFNDSLLMDKMYAIYQKIATYCQDNDLMDEGSLSATEFERWCRCIMLYGVDTMEEMAQECVVNKATSDSEHQQKIMSTIVATNLM